MFGLRLGKLGAAIKAGTGSAGVVPLFSRDYEATGSLGADATFTRASTATYVDSNGVIQTAAINTPRFDYSTGSRALLMEPAATNYLLNSGTPATQTTGSLGTGTYVLWVEGSGSAAVTAGTATITGGGTATDGTPDTFTVTGAGTVTVTVTGTLDRFQLELGTTPTSYIPTSGSTVTRAADALSYPLTTPQTEGMAIASVIELTAGANYQNANFGYINFHTSDARSPVGRYGSSAVNSDGTTSNAIISLHAAGDSAVYAGIWETGSTYNIGRNYSSNPGWAWDPTPANYDGGFVSANVVRIFANGTLPIAYKSIQVFDSNQGQAWIEANY